MQCHHLGSRAYVAALGRMRLQTQVSLQGMVYASAIDARGKQKGTHDDDDDDDDDDDVRSCFTPSPLR